jgi:hypothetical protein
MSTAQGAISVLSIHGNKIHEYVEISGSHGGEDVNVVLLGCNAV